MQNPVCSSPASHPVDLQGYFAIQPKIGQAEPIQDKLNQEIRKNKFN